MTETIVQFFQSWMNNDYLTLFLISIIPIIELRGAIILMGGMTGISKIAGMFVCLAGSSIVIFPLLLCLRPILKKLKKTKLFGKIAGFFEELFSSKASGVNEKAEKRKISSKASPDTKKFLGLTLFVGVPLPFTGAWTGSGVGAFMDIKIWKAALAIFIGNLFAASVLTLLTAFIPVKYIDIVLWIFLALVILSLVISFGVALYKHKKRTKQTNGEVQSVENADGAEKVADAENLDDSGLKENVMQDSGIVESVSETNENAKANSADVNGENN
ncbi:MAG: small multi-drug export protein [Christensenellales bacterium]